MTATAPPQIAYTRPVFGSNGRSSLSPGITTPADSVPVFASRTTTIGSFRHPTNTRPVAASWASGLFPWAGASGNVSVTSCLAGSITATWLGSVRLT